MIVKTSRSNYVRQRDAKVWRPIHARRRRTAELRTAQAKAVEHKFGESLFEQTWMPPYEQSGPYAVETESWPESRHLQWVVGASSLVAAGVVGWLLWRIFGA
ncbi:hypothetical protein [Xylophilus sp. GOD-11R]|uniref:hypothetical protein n=1 Tax=Xylophilus sp. GOD-11R TaxID=3089814 RepID=UPI00298D3B60|nr:hypothetical protein [Xylophilus sp. GOD-11R]WPB54966.1 hypothetical protein R9X41_12360 [Xylophilus sp. GOD-11R]